MKFEYALTLKSSTKHVDIALFASEDAKSPRCIVEVKRVGRLGLEGEEQLFEYAFHSGVPVALLTDGAQWRFYITHLPGSYEERLVRLLDVERHPPDEIAEALLRYLSYENTRSDQARKNAEADLDQRVTRDKARKSIPQAWKQLTEDGEDDRLSRNPDRRYFFNLRVRASPAGASSTSSAACNSQAPIKRRNLHRGRAHPDQAEKALPRRDRVVDRASCGILPPGRAPLNTGCSVHGTRRKTRQPRT